jgi:hypothetical protein
MQRFVFDLAIQVAIWLPILVAIFMVLFVRKSARKEHYLKRVASKYSISPLFGQSRLTLLREVQKRST